MGVPYNESPMHRGFPSRSSRSATTTDRPSSRMPSRASQSAWWPCRWRWHLPSRPGMPPQAGIYCAIVAGFMTSALGGSLTAIGGPTGAFVVVVAGIIGQYGVNGLFLCTHDGRPHPDRAWRDRCRIGRQIHSAAGHRRLHQRHRRAHREHATSEISSGCASQRCPTTSSSACA